MICPKCNEERGCSCTWHVVLEYLDEKICSICAEDIRQKRIKDDPATRVVSVSSVPIQPRNIQEGEDKTIWHQTLPE